MQMTQTYLEIVASRGNRRLPLERVYRHLPNRELLLRAYEKLYPNKGALTPGTDPTDSIDGMSLQRIDQVVEALKAGNYHWKPARRVYIPKANGKLRPLGIPNWTDKLVQEAIRQVLSAYYEPQFSSASHGFRPGRGCHTALQQIRREWTGTKWFIEGDIKGCFDNIDHEKLLAVIGRSIKDTRLLSLLRGMLAAGYLEDWRYEQTHSGTPQGGVLSPLLANIFLNELDTFVETVLKPKYTRGEHRGVNPEYGRMKRALRSARLHKEVEECRHLTKERRKLPSGKPDDPDFRRLRYVRYADDFLIGFIGPKEEAEQVKQAIGEYLQTLGLTLSGDKTLITHAMTQRARFLGYEIFTGQANDSLTEGQRRLNGRSQLSVPKDVVTKWIGRYSKRSKPIQQAWLLNYSDYEIVTSYGRQLRGLANYYALAHDVSARVGKVKWVMEVSLVKTLAGKHRQSVRQVYRNHQRDLRGYTAIVAAIPRANKRPLVATFGGFSIRHREHTVIEDSRRGGPWKKRTEMAQRLLHNRCELCGSDEDVEMHHIRKLANLFRKRAGRRPLEEWEKVMIAMRRKTLAVCHRCHQAITHGKYDGRRLR